MHQLSQNRESVRCNQDARRVPPLFLSLVSFYLNKTSYQTEIQIENNEK